MAHLETLAWGLVALLLVALAILSWEYQKLKRSRVATTKKPVKVLIVEDEPVSRLILLKVCARLGYTVVQDVSNGMDAWRILRDDTTINVLITDLQIPGIDGNELISLAETLPRKVYVIIISGSPSLIKGVSRKHMFLEKPVSFARLLGIFEQIDVD